MLVLLAGGLALWTLAAIFVLSICRAAAHADENDSGRRLSRLRRGATVSLAAAAATGPAVPGEAAARACADRHVQFEAAPAQMRKALLCEIDRVRARRDARGLDTDRELRRAAGRHARDMRRRRYFSHVSPGGGDLADRARRAGYARDGCTWRVGEVLAWGAGPRATAAATVRAWLRSRGHRRILVSRRYREVGVGLRAGTPFGLPSGVTVAAVLGRRACSG